ncbi:integrase catalytic domain-containing protein [Trichonephila clavipes]|nr:integrase catalytic domain-containing protein [Trichonephila clavipes]
MKEQLKQGIIERCTENFFAGYVMPHREVFRENYSSTKTGVVYDASSKQENNLSLKECLIPGENLLNLIHSDVTLKCIEYLQNLMIPRYYYSPTNLINRNDLQLHVFPDASPKSFGAVAYLRYKISDSNFNTRFLISKSRVAPIKKITLTRLELMGAVIAARLVKHFKRIFKDIKRIILWSDSTIALYWNKGSASKFKPFVSNRISEILENADPASWRHCRGKQNPADLLTRGLTSKELMNSEKWWHGPEWLTELLIWESHKRVLHSGVSHTLVQVREKYWILKARQTIKSLLKRCISCKRFDSNPGSQVSAPLPDIRMTESPPFSVVGLDFAGLLFVKDNDAKQYILLITCPVTRSIHLELVGSMTTDTFLLAFRRCVALRGLCSIVISDNARTFKRAE